jgi:hypothetical protein
MDERYTVQVSVPSYVTRLESVMYWRNDRKVSDAAYASMQVENCGFHLVGDEALEAIRAADPSFEPPEVGEGEALFYHEWY